MGPFSKEELNLDVLRLRYEDQAESLRDMLKLDVQVFIAYMTVQLVFGGWIAEKSPNTWPVRVALGCADVAVSAIVLAYFLNSDRRRKESTATIRHINDALKFNIAGVYIVNSAINPPEIQLPWWERFRFMFIVGALASLLAVCGLLVVAPLRNDAISPPQVTNIFDTPSPPAAKDTQSQQGEKQSQTTPKRAAP